MRHRLLLAAAASAAAADTMPATALPSAAATAARPNIVLMVSDDQRWDALGVEQRERGEAARFPFFETPNLDRLAAEGARARNAFVVQSLCSPTRACLMTGLYNHANGVVDNGTPFPKQPMWSESFAAAGYATAYIGKWHHGSQKERPGFQWVASFLNQGRYNGCEFLINGTREVAKAWVDDASAQYAVRFMREHQAQPFVLILGFKTPHRTWEPPKAWAKRWEGASIRPAANRTARAPWVAKSVSTSPAAPANDDSDDEPASTEKHASANETELDYFRCLGAMDASVGTVLQGIDELGLRDNTLVVFMSDNGHYKGEHGMGDKRSAYEESIRIPLLARWPGRIPAGSTPEQQIINVDLPATFCAVAGVTPPVAMHGRDASGVLAGTPPSDWRRSWLYTYWTDFEYPETPAHVALRTETHKLIVYRDQPSWTELFDLRSDSLEMHNLANDPAQAALRSDLERQLAAEKAAVQFRDPPGWPKKPRPRNRPKK